MQVVVVGTVDGVRLFFWGSGGGGGESAKRDFGEENSEDEGGEDAGEGEDDLGGGGVGLAIGEAERELGERAEISVEKEAWGLAKSDPEEGGLEADFGDPVEIIEEAGGEEGVELTEEDNFPAIEGDGLIEGGPFGDAEEFFGEPMAEESSAEKKGDGGSEKIAEETDEEA